MPLRHWLLAVHGVVAAPLATQVPVAPGVAQYLVVPWQSASTVHAVLHAVALAQAKPPAQGAAEPGVQEPVPLHEPAPVRMPAAQAAAPQLVLMGG